MATFVTTQTTVARYAAGLYGLKLGAVTNQAVLADVQLNSANGVSGLNTVLNAAYAPFAKMTSAQVAAIVVANAGIVAGRYGLTATNVSDAVASVTAALNAAAPLGQQGKAIADVLADWSNDFTADPVFGPAATAWNLKVAQAVAYATPPILLTLASAKSLRSSVCPALKTKTALEPLATTPSSLYKALSTAPTA